MSTCGCLRRHDDLHRGVNGRSNLAVIAFQRYDREPQSL